jgi:ABC-2 type transport system ATP-binding protein
MYNTQGLVGNGDMVVTGAKNINAIEIIEVNKSCNSTKVVNGISLEVRYGEILDLICPNGAGKTTTIRMAMDIIKPDSGQISILGKSLCDQN